MNQTSLGIFWTDTHCHLDYSERPAEQIQRAIDVGVRRLITIGVSTEHLPRLKEIAHQHSEVYFTAGLHPHEAKNFSPDYEAELRSFLKDPKCLALGEIGLDYHYMHSPKEVQQQVFHCQIEIALEHQLPIAIHTREAELDTMAVLKPHLASAKAAGSHFLFHSFSSNRELLDFGLAEDFYFGINGMITFPKAQNVREALELIPLNRLLLETDSPYLAPIPYRGKTNEPAYLVEVAKKVAEIKDIELAALSEVLEQNARQFFRKLS